MFRNSKFIAVLVAVLVLSSITAALPAEAAVYSAPALSSPASNQVLTNYPRVATFKWLAVSGVSSYQFEIACDTCVSKTNLYANTKTYSVSGTSYTVQVPGSDNIFRWRVRGKDSASYGPWSGYRYFSYKTGGSAVTTVPVITSPTNNASFPVDSNVYFAWTHAATNVGVSYDLIIEKNSGASWQTYKTNQIWLGLTSTNMKMTEAGNYRVKIRTLTNNGGSEAYGSWSAYTYFTVASGAINGPAILNPYENQLINQYSRNVYISWMPVTGADGYRINIWRDGVSGSETIDVTNGATSHTYTATADDGQYHLKIAALKRSSSYSDYYIYSNWSETRNFRYVYYNNSYTGGIPSLISPTDESTIYNNYITLDWSTVSGATSYEYQVTRFTGSEWVSVAGATVSATDAYITLPAGTYGQYSFRVRAIENGVYGSWSNYNQFYYYGGSNNYNAPTIYSPYNQTYIDHSVYMNWSGVSGAVSYEISVNYESNSNWYEEGAYSTANLSYTKYFSYDNHYRMKVRAKFSDSSYGNWSEWREFRVGDSGSYNYGAPAISYPLSGVTYTSQSVYMSWSTVSGAASYEINVQYESNGNWYEEGTYSTTNAYYSKYFSNNNEYRVKVRAKFSGNSYGSWSEWREFIVNTGGSANSGVPAISSPAQNAMVQNSTHQVSIGWSAVYNAASYEIEMARDGYSTETIYPGNIMAYSYYASATNASYHFRVRARLNDSTYTGWSDWRYFQYYYSTSGNTASPPIVTSPTAGQIFTGYNIYFSWLNVSGATGYDIEFAYLSGSNWLTESTYSSTVNYYNRNFSSSNDYRVRARAKFSDSSMTDWSDWVQFKISH